MVAAAGVATNTLPPPPISATVDQALVTSCHSFTPKTPSSTSYRDHSLCSLGSIMTPAAYTNAPTTSCGGGGIAVDAACIGCHPPTSGSECNIMRVIDQTFRDNPDIFTDDYLKRCLVSRDSQCSEVSLPPTVTPTCTISRELAVALNYDGGDDYEKKVEAKNIKNSRSPIRHTIACDCIQKLYTSQDSAWQMSDCKMIQSRIEYFESYQPDNESTPTSKTLFMFKEDKITTADSKKDDDESKLKPGTGLTARSACSSCCYCNPDLHNDPNQRPESCAFCKSKTPRKDVPETPTPVRHCFETMKRSNHIHTRIKSKDSDSVSVKCTKEKIKRSFYPDAMLKEKPKVAAKVNSGLSRPKEINNLPRVSSITVQKEVRDEIVKSPTKRGGHRQEFRPIKRDIRLPSPDKINCKSYASTSSSSTCSSPNCSPKKTVLPPAHWQHQPPLSLPKTNPHHSSYQHHKSPSPIHRPSHGKSKACATPTLLINSNSGGSSSNNNNEAVSPLTSNHASYGLIADPNLNSNNNNNNNFETSTTIENICTNPIINGNVNNNNNNNINANNNNHTDVNNEHNNQAAPGCTPNIITTCSTNVNNHGTITNTGDYILSVYLHIPKSPLN